MERNARPGIGQPHAYADELPMFTRSGRLLRSTPGTPFSSIRNPIQLRCRLAYVTPMVELPRGIACNGASQLDWTNGTSKR